MHKKGVIEGELRIWVDFLTCILVFVLFSRGGCARARGSCQAPGLGKFEAPGDGSHPVATPVLAPVPSSCCLSPGPVHH